MGCGTGHMTLAIARRFDPAHILGVELDERLVHAAKQNIRHFLSHDLVVEARRTRRRGGEQVEVKKMEEEEEMMEEVQQALSLLSFPLSFRVSRGPISAPPLLPPSSSSSSSSLSSASKFPSNVTFIQVSLLQLLLHHHHCDIITAVTPPTGRLRVRAGGVAWLGAV